MTSPASKDVAAALGILRPALSGRKVTRVLLDYSVTLQFNDRTPHAELKLESPFLLCRSGVAEERVEPERLGPPAQHVAGLFPLVVNDVDINDDCTLNVTFDDGTKLSAPPDDDYESWSFVDNDGALIHCLPKPGGLAYWSPRG